ncbi:MAG: hypothetical protein R3B72_04085 [Polyangiaceae bacterium]
MITRARSFFRWLTIGFLGLAPLTGCGGETAPPEDDGKVTEPAPEEAWPNLECDPLVPSFCAFPWPSNVYTVEDASTPTGRRVNVLDGSLPVSAQGKISSMVGLLPSDGFSTAAALLAEMPGATEAGFPTPLDIERSLADDSPTILLEATTGERVPHFTELDHSAPSKEEETLMIRPVVRLKDATRYIVAIRGVQGTDGTLPASEAFAALRDRLPSEEPSVEDRRGLYADIFGRLGDAGIARDDLQLAWDFTTASRDNNTALLVHMRDEALEAAGPNGPPYTITMVEPDPDPQIAFRIEGTMTAPLYLTSPDPGGRLVLGQDGLPEPNPSQPTREVPWRLLIPKSAETTPAALLQYGHGLLGSLGQIESFKDLANDYGYAIFGLTLIGMGDDDSTWIADQLTSGDVAGLTAMFERQHQGMLEYLLAMRMMSRGFAQDPTYGALLDGDQRYYHGISQGGIFGGTYMALSTDVTRGVLGVMGMPYNLLLNRSVDFGVFFALFQLSYPDPRAQQLLLNMIQLFWDRTEPNGYVPYIREDLLPNTPAHEVLMRAAIGDHQVSTLGAQLMARAAGAKHLRSGLRDVYGLEAIDGATSGSGYVEYGFGLPDEPICNIPMTSCEDPHGLIRKLEASKQQLDTFLRTGELVNACPDGICSFPDQGMCDASDATPPCL